MDQSDPREGHQVDAVIESKVIAADSREGDLEEISCRSDLHQWSDREVSIEKVVTAERQVEYRVIDCSGCESQAAPESPAIFVSVRPGCERGEASDQDGQQTGGAGQS